MALLLLLLRVCVRCGLGTLHCYDSVRGAGAGFSECSESCEFRVAEVGAVFLVHVRRRGRGLTDGAGFMARRYGWVHVYRREGRNVGEIKFGECVTHRRWKGVQQCMALLQNK